MDKEKIVVVEHEDSVSVTINDVTYELSREITGGQFMELRRKSMKPVIENGKESTDIRLDSVEFDLWNLHYRLLEPKLSMDELQNLSRSTYQNLTLLAGKLDNNEAGIVSDFLQENSSLFQTSLSALTALSDSLPDSSEATSE